MALGVYGFGCEDALIHLLNYVWPNIFETSPHLIQAFMGAIEGFKISLGPIKMLQYTLQVINMFIIMSFMNDFLFIFRVCFILQGKCVMFIGRFTTHYISVVRIRLFLVIQELKTIIKTITFVMNLIMSYKHLS